jgi:murein DD-endopeptidase MepM/ murein hydrolase activator NlpD
MRELLSVSIILLFSLTSQLVHAATVYYQPTPYPAMQADGTIMDQTNLSIVHVWEGWLSKIYYNQTFQRANGIQIGGSTGDKEWMYIKFDLTGLPQDVDRALILLMPYAIPSQFASVPYAVCPVTSSWELSMTWSTQPSVGTCYGWYPAPTAGSWSWVWLSGTGGPDWYNQWTNPALATLVNNGVMLFPQAADNNLDAFYSTLYNSYTTDPYADARRPILQLDFTPTLVLKMPLRGVRDPEKLSWLVTTEVGGYDCLGHAPDGSNDPWPDPYHSDSTVPGNYFSIDFSWKNKDINGAQVYSSGDNIPVLAAADGIVTTFPLSQPNAVADNGNFVVVTHGTTGFTTRYLHLKSIAVANNTSVTQGTLLGYMGNTGLSKGVHLHFGVRYNGSGSSTVPELAKVVMDGWLLKSFQTECSVDTTGTPAAKIRYYQSSNYY